MEQALEMKHRVDIDFIGNGNAGAVYGGYLRAWSFEDVEGPAWFRSFRDTALQSIGTRHFPVYRMADGEFRFLLGRMYNLSTRPLLRHLLGVTAEKLRIRDPDNFKNGWNEGYPPEDMPGLRVKLIEDIRYVLETGFLAPYLNDNGLNAFVEHNRAFLRLCAVHGLSLRQDNTVPFHFAAALLINSGWQDFVQGRSILVVTSHDERKAERISASLKRLGAAKVSFLQISATTSMTDVVDLSAISETIDLSLLAAGIGAANILRQLEPIGTLAVDIGSTMHCFVDPTARPHAGVLALPEV